MELINFPKRKPMPCPFGGGNDANITPIEMVSSQNVNFYDGFPSVYGAPSANNGKFVTRKEMNAIGNLASNDLFYHKCGGLNTFDPEFALKIGGYAKGAVLQALIGNDIVYVRSLVDNNKVDFTGSATQDQVNTGIINGRIDGVNWVQCNSDFTRRQYVLFNLPESIPTATATIATPVTIFQATTSGFVDTIGSATPVIWSGGVGSALAAPFIYLSYKESANGTSWGQDMYFYHLGPGTATSGVTGIVPFKIKAGYFYSVTLYVGANNSNSPSPSGLSYTDSTIKGVLAI